MHNHVHKSMQCTDYKMLQYRNYLNFHVSITAKCIALLMHTVSKDVCLYFCKGNLDTIYKNLFCYSHTPVHDNQDID